VSKFKFEIAGKVYATKTAVLAQAKEILNRYPENQSLSEADFEWMLSLLEHHPDADDKIGCGVTRMWVQQNPEYPTTRTFYLERPDGTSINFSYPACVTPRTPLQDFKRAARRAIASYTRVTRDLKFLPGTVVNCPVNGTMLTEDGKSCHVHHHGMTFDEIVTDFIRVKNIDVEVVRLRRPEHGGVVFDDPDLEKSWTTFHNESADLEVVSQRANLSDLNKRD